MGSMIMEAAGTLIKTFQDKAGAIATSLLAGAFGFAATQITTGNLLLAVAASIASAGIANWPRIIKAKSDATTSERTITSSETAIMFSRLHDEVEFHVKANAVLRISTHNALNECQRLGFHIEELNAILLQNGLNPPPFRKQTLDQIRGDEDKKMSELTEVKENGKHNLPQ